MRIFSKYFSILLILVLIQSNFSFAITQMLCRMDNFQTTCECEDPCRNESQITSEESQCCKVLIHEISNTNILELNKLKFNPGIKFNIIESFLPLNLHVNLQSDLSQTFRLHLIHFIPPADIPILFSHILI